MEPHTLNLRYCSQKNWKTSIQKNYHFRVQFINKNNFKNNLYKDKKAYKEADITTKK